MPIIKCNNHIDVYKERAIANEFELLNGRNNQYTDIINNNIINKILFQKNDIVADIGCGNASLLLKISSKIKLSYGFLPSKEEVTLVSNKINCNNINIIKSFSNNINSDNNFFDKVICNGVLILLNNDDVNKTLSEIQRISKHNAIVFLGEIPFTDESNNKKYRDSIFLWLLNSLFKQSIKKFMQNIKTVLLSILNKSKPFIIAPKTYYFINENEFIKKLHSYNFEVIDINQHNNMNKRNNYVIKVKKEINDEN